MIIRPARLDEADALTDLSMRSKQSNGYDEAFMAACRDELTVTADRMTDGTYWVAEVNGVIRGCVCLSVDADNATGEINAFFIDPDFQRRGIGQVLWRKILEEAQELQTLRLDADPAAAPFYEKLGFVTVRNVPSGSIKGRTLPHMVLKL